MKANMGQVDRLIRLILAVIFILAIVLQWVTGVAAIILGILAIIFIATSIIRVCPLYLPFGLKTFK